MILNEFQKAFDNLGVKRIDAVGQDFNPNLHEAVGREPTSEMEEGKVLRQWKAGFEMNGKLLRPATVVVAAAPPDAAPATAEPSAEGTAKEEGQKEEGRAFKACSFPISHDGTESRAIPHHLTTNH